MDSLASIVEAAQNGRGSIAKTPLGSQSKMVGGTQKSSIVCRSQIYESDMAKQSHGNRTPADYQAEVIEKGGLLIGGGEIETFSD